MGTVPAWLISSHRAGHNWHRTTGTDPTSATQCFLQRKHSQRKPQCRNPCHVSLQSYAQFNTVFQEDSDWPITYQPSVIMGQLAWSLNTCSPLILPLAMSSNTDRADIITTFKKMLFNHPRPFVWFIHILLCTKLLTIPKISVVPFNMQSLVQELVLAELCNVQGRE